MVGGFVIATLLGMSALTPTLQAGGKKVVCTFDLDNDTAMCEGHGVKGRDPDPNKPIEVAVDKAARKCEKNLSKANKEKDAKVAVYFEHESHCFWWGGKIYC